MTRILRITGTAVASCLISFSPAFAQTFNFGTGVIGPVLRTHHDPVLSYEIGGDFPLSDRWSVRVEAGRRLPDTQIRSFTTERYLLGIRLDSRTTVEETSIVDTAVLARFGSPRDRTVQFGALAGLNFQAVNVVDRTFIPHSRTDPSDGVETTLETFRFDTVFDVGGDMAVRVDDKWTLTIYGIAGIQPPYNEEKRPQLRAGLLAQYRIGR